MCLSARGVLNRFLRPREVGEMILASFSQCHGARCLVFHFATRQTIYFSSFPYMPCAVGPVSRWTGMLDVYRKSKLRPVEIFNLPPYLTHSWEPRSPPADQPRKHPSY